MSDQFVAECWGCGQQVSLPVYTSVFRCGHCGALSYDYEVTGAPAESPAAEAESGEGGSSSGTGSRSSSSCCSSLSSSQVGHDVITGG